MHIQENIELRTAGPAKGGELKRPSNATSAAAERLATMMSRRAGVGPWPTASEAPLPAGRQRKAVGAGTKISARLGALSVRMVATASATYARMDRGSVEARVLLALGSGPQTSSQIGKLIGVDRAAVCRAVSSLLERDLVLKLDGRARSVRLTGEGEGEALIEGINQVTAERERRLLEGFSDQEAAALLGFLGRLMLNAPGLTELAESQVFAALRD
jgi:DNA-binding MarR family transcriptional regulator